MVNARLEPVKIVELKESSSWVWFQKDNVQVELTSPQWIS